MVRERYCSRGWLTSKIDAPRVVCLSLGCLYYGLLRRGIDKLKLDNGAYRRWVSELDVDRNSAPVFIKKMALKYTYISGDYAGTVRAATLASTVTLSWTRHRLAV
jgi:hypothetical protein